MRSRSRAQSRRSVKLQRERMCGKVRFRDKREAVDFVHYAANARYVVALDEEYGAATTHRACRAYLCGRCHGYHVTSQEQPVAVMSAHADRLFGQA